VGKTKSNCVQDAPSMTIQEACQNNSRASAPSETQMAMASLAEHHCHADSGRQSAIKAQER